MAYQRVMIAKAGKTAQQNKQNIIEFYTKFKIDIYESILI